jgi:HlyD family secretion protein
VSNPELILMPGMTAYVSIVVAQQKDTLIVPNAALRFKPSDTDKPAKIKPRDSVENKDNEKARRDSFAGRVHILKNGKIMSLNVKLGITDNRNTEIISGELKAGDQVITGESQASQPGNGSQPMRMRMF